MEKRSTSLRRTVLASSLLSLLTACGGGGDSSTGGGDGGGGGGISTVTLRGTVAVVGLVQGTVVCMDLNGSNTCDTGEPASAATGSNGTYALSYDPSALSSAAVAAASLIAPQVRGVTIDSVDGLITAEDADYVLKQVPGKAGQINPLTTLLATGIAAGMTEDEARSNLAIQLAIDAGKIDDYQSDPAPTEDLAPDNARTMAAVVAYTLEQNGGVTLSRQTAAVNGRGSELRRLQFTDTANFNLSEFAYTAKPEGTVGGSLTDVRRGQTGGASLGNLYNQAYLGPNGWVRCDETVPLTFTLGTPSRSTFCGAQLSVGGARVQSVAGQTMSGVVNSLLADPLNFINVGSSSNTGLLTALGSSAIFPAGSAVREGFSLNLNQPVFINSLNSDGQPQSRATTLEQLVAARPTAGVDLSNSFGTLSLGGYTEGSSNRGLRVAFTGSGQGVQYYVCDANTDFSAFTNCAATATGTYSIVTENGVRVMRFQGQPVIPINNIRLYVEVRDATQTAPFISGNWVFQARQLKPQSDLNYSESKRFNGVASAAFKMQLGL